MQFDPNATLTAICTLIAVLGCQFLFFWLRDRRSPWLAWYAAACLFGAAAVLLYLISSKGNEFLLLGTGNAARILAFAFLWHGAREFVGRKPEQLVVVLAIAVWMALCSIPAFLYSMPARIIGASLFIMLFCGLGAFELWRNRAEMLPSQIPVAITYASFGLFAAIRIPLVNVAPFPVGALPINGLWVAVFGLVVFIHATFLVGFVVSMTRERAEREQRKFALIDPLTGLFNRRAFVEQVEGRGRRRRHTREPVGVLVLDLDHFKQINDRYGHEAGDLMLQHFATISRLATRPHDQLYRMGGEEFCFILPGAGLAEAKGIAERVRASFEQSAIETGGRSIKATVSIGVTAAEHAGVDLELLVAAADGALYEAKARARNQTVVVDGHVLPQLGTLRRSAA